jgi:omega-amidase
VPGESLKTLTIGLCCKSVDFHGGKLRSRSPDVLIFPELAAGGYSELYRGNYASLVENFLSSCKAISRRLPLTCIAGSVPLKRKKGRSVFNTSVVFQNGRRRYSYRKIHLFKPTRDNEYFRPGTEVGVFQIPVGRERIKAGIAICYDVRFPELIRRMALSGISLLFVPARWPVTRDDAWHTLLKARAMENQIFVVGCNSYDNEGGYSYVFDPSGKLLFSNRGISHKHTHQVRLDLASIDRARSFHDNLSDARLL